MTILHNVERYGTRGDWRDPSAEKFVELSFETKYRGIYQCGCNDSGLYHFQSEPPFESLTKEEQNEIKEISKIVFYITHGKLP